MLQDNRQLGETLTVKEIVPYSTHTAGI